VTITADRWSEHVKRVHFPDQVWECPKINQRSCKPCGSKPFFRPDNFATHLRGEHAYGVEEISRLKKTCKFRTRGLFHQVCGFCDETFENRDDSIEHIKNHFREISERSDPTQDFGTLGWKGKCKSDHKLKRGVHYDVRGDTEHGNSDRDTYGDDGDSGPGQGNSGSQTHDHFQDQQDRSLPENGDGGAGDNGDFYYCQDSSYMDCQQDSNGGPGPFPKIDH
jgi:hypothetical protein